MKGKIRSVSNDDGVWQGVVVVTSRRKQRVYNYISDTIEVHKEDYVEFEIDTTSDTKVARIIRISTIDPEPLTNAQSATDLVFSTGEQSTADSGTDQTIPAECIEKLRQIVRSVIVANGILLVEKLPALMVRNGIMSFHQRSRVPRWFIERYLDDYIYKPGGYFDNEYRPPILVMNEYVLLPFADEDKAALDQFFDSGDYYGFLSSWHFTQYRPIDLPIEYLEKALTCAKRLLTQDENAVITLNPFQKALLSTDHASKILEYFKKGTATDYDALEECLSTSIPTCRISDRLGRMQLSKQLFNSVKTLASTSRRSDYAGLIKRTKACMNEIYPYLVLIDILIHPDERYELLTDMCNSVMYVNREKMISSFAVSTPENMLYLPALVSLCEKHALLTDPSRKFRTTFFLMYANLDALDEINRFSRLFAEPQYQYLIRLYSHYETFTEEDYKNMFALPDGITKATLQIVVAQIWDRIGCVDFLPVPFLSLLAFTLKYNKINSVDEILWKNSIVAKGSKVEIKNKCTALIGSYPTIISELKNHDAFIALGESVKQSLAKITDLELAEEIAKTTAMWEDVRDEYFEKNVAPLLPVTAQSADELVSLFRVFRIDFDHEIIMQNDYADWIEAQFDFSKPPEEVDQELVNLYNQGAYGAYYRVFTRVYSGCYDKANKELITNCLDSMKSLHLFREAMQFVIENDLHDHIKKMTIDVCLEFKISEQTRSIINHAWSIEEAIAHLSEKYTPNDKPLIKALIILYCLKGMLFHAYYLYECYKTIIDSEYKQQFLKAFKCIASLKNKNQPTTENRYHVILIAFEVLSTEQLIDFLAWCGSLKLSESREQTAKDLHPFAVSLDIIIQNARDPMKLRSVYYHMLEHPEVNTWKLCVCANMITFLEKNSMNEFAQETLQYAENQLENIYEMLPPNLFSMICPFLSFSDSHSIFHTLLTRLNKKIEGLNRICNDPITQNEKPALQEFLQACAERLNTNNDDDCFDLIEHLAKPDELFKLVNFDKLMERAKGRIQLLRHFCKLYTTMNRKRVQEILYNEHWNTTEYLESHLLSIVRFLYDTSDELTAKYLPDKLIDSEEEVMEIKKRVADILSYYPSKEGLIGFNKQTAFIRDKMLVLSIVLPVLFDQKISNRIIDTEYDLLIDEGALDRFLFYAYKLYQYQLYHNCFFNLLYLEERYQKALVALCLMDNRFGLETDDTEIIECMEYFDHKELSFETKYLPFKDALISFGAPIAEQPASEPSHKLRKMILLSLLNSDFGAFFEECCTHQDEAVSIFNEKELKFIIEEVAHKDFGIEVIKNYKNHPERLDLLLKLSKPVSSSLSDVLRYLKEHHDPEMLGLFSSLTMKSAGGVAMRIMKCSAEEFDRYRDLFVPMLTAVQEPNWIYDRLFGLVVKEDTSERYLSVLLYMEQTYPQASTVYRFLRCAQAALMKDKELLDANYNETDFMQNLPEAWNAAFQMLKKFRLSGMKGGFTLLDLNGDASFRSAQSSHYQYIHPIAEHLDIQQPENTEMRSIITAYRNAKSKKKVEYGIRMLLGYQAFQQTPSFSLKEDAMPVYHEAVYKVGMDILETELEITPELRVMILSDLRSIVNQRWIAKKNYFDSFSRTVIEDLVSDGIELRCWCDFFDQICSMLQADDKTKKELDEIGNQVIPDLKAVMDPSFPLDQRLETLRSLQIAASYYTRIAGHLQRAVEREIKRLEKGIRLCVEIVNDTCTDGYVYAQIRNIGQSTVNLMEGGNHYVRITLSVNDNPNEIHVQTNNITELRHDNVSGFRMKLPSKLDSLSSIIVTVSARIDDVLYSRCRKELEIVHHEPTVSVEHTSKWYNVDSAVTAEEMLFGRDDDKEQLRQSLKNGITVLYGPSRIGKTSLLNWVRRFLSKQIAESPESPVKRIITVLLAGEGCFKDRDFVSKFFDTTQMLDYSSASDISEYLLNEAIVNSFGEPRRFAVKGEELPPEMQQQIITRLSDTSVSLENRYMKLDDYLRANHTELWILMDEFQQVVQRWQQIDHTTTPFANVCSDLMVSNDEFPHAVRLVLCGSDELLKQMTSTDQSVWRQIIPNTGVLVSALPKDGFKKMICEAENFPKDRICYSDSAIDALYSYTGGIALYGKEICNTIQDQINTDQSFFAHRKTIYSSDVSWAVQKLLICQENEQKPNAKVTAHIVHIYDAVVKNLDEATDKLFLMYIAQWLRENFSRDSFPKSVFSTMCLKPLYHETIEGSIEIAVKRGILREQRDENGIVCAYTFTTVFYYYAFLGINKMSCEQFEKLMSADEVDTEAEIDQQPHSAFLDVKEGIKELSPDEKYELLSVVYMDTAIPSDKMEEFKKRAAGDIINTNTYIGSQSIQVNVQNIKNTLNGILAANVDPQQILEGLSSLPRLDAYTAALTTNGQELTDARLSYAIEGYVNDLEEGIQEAVEENEKQLRDPWVILQITEDEYWDISRKYKIPTCFEESLQLADQLEQIFRKGIVGGELPNIDYSPVSIMYCKLIESMLKEYHTDVYSIALGSFQTDLKKNSVSKYSWSEIRGLTLKQKLTIGSFVFPISASSGNPSGIVKRNIEDLRAFTKTQKSDWIAHAAFISDMRDIRNPSAHGNKGQRIDLEQLNDLNKKMFEERGFIRLIDIAADPN